MNPSFPAACTSEMTPLTKDSPTFSWAPTKTTVSLGSKGNRGFRGRGGAAEGTSIRVYTDTSDPQLVTTTSRTVFRAAFLEKAACQFQSIDKPLFPQSRGPFSLIFSIPGCGFSPRGRASPGPADSAVPAPRPAPPLSSPDPPGQMGTRIPPGRQPLHIPPARRSRLCQAHTAPR